LGTFAGVLFGRPAVSLVGLGVLVWIAGEWLLFLWRSELLVRRLRVHRQLRDHRGGTLTLWVDRSFQVTTRVGLEGPGTIPYLVVQERLPASLQLAAGKLDAEGAITSGKPIELTYAVRPPAAGEAIFEGVSVRVADVQGFFYAERFVTALQVCRILPSIAWTGPIPPLFKRYNLLPPPGKHRHPRPGVGSELLQIRDYVPGDPLKSIAWKVSARRNRFMSKDFENEVPVRCTLFLDASNSVRIGHPGPNALTQLVALAASIAQTALADRDPVGLCVFDERNSQFFAPARSVRQMTRILDQLAQTARLPTNPVDCPVTGLIDQAFVYCEEVHPELLRPKVNRVPFRIFPLRAKRRTQRHRRAQMVSVLAEYFRLRLTDPVRLLHDDRWMAELLQRFLGEHQVGYEVPLYDAAGNYRFAASDKVQVLARALNRSVRKGHDNELYCIMADLLELEEQLEPVFAAIRVALARHHKVMVLCAWPSGLEPPSLSSRVKLLRPALALGDPSRVLIDADHHRFHHAFVELRRRLGRFRVPLVCAAEGRSAHEVIAQMELLRSGRARR
jgi:uncharacterized protein (DUF58 family)